MSLEGNMLNKLRQRKTNAMSSHLDMESENMTKSHPHTLAEVTIQRGSSFTSLEFNKEVRVREKDYIIMSILIIFR